MLSKPVVLNRDLWSFVGQADAICITTNGCVKNNGRAVMGRGNAAQAKLRLPDVDLVLGCDLKINGNKPSVLYQDITGGSHIKTALVSFPTKGGNTQIIDLQEVMEYYRHQYKVGNVVPGWALKSDLELIKASAKALVEIASANNWLSVVLPAPGCGNGGLDPQVVFQALEEILDDRFIIVYRPAR